MADAEGLPALSHVRRGSGEPLVLVHGLGSECGVWRPQLERLAGERDVAAFDLPGFGESPPLPSGDRPTVERLTRAVADAMTELGLERPHVAGFSLGGGIALELARAGRARSATALAPVGFWTSRERAYEQRLFRLTIAAMAGRPELSAKLARNVVVRTLAVAHLCARPWRIPPDDAERGVANMLRSPGFEPTLEAHLEYRFRGGDEIRVPLTVAWGDRDYVLLSRQRHRAARALPQARHVLLRGCGHVPHWDDVDAVTRVLLEGSAS